MWANDGHPAFKYCKIYFFVSYMAFTVKHPSRDMKKKRDYCHNVSRCWPEKTCHFSSTVYVRTFNISPPAGIQSHSKLLSVVLPPVCSAFLIRFLLLCIISIFEVHSVWNDAKCQSCTNLIMSDAIHIWFSIWTAGNNKKSFDWILLMVITT